MRARLYGLTLSHPSHAVRLMLERKRIPYEFVELMPGLHPIVVRLRGFARNTVPALVIDGIKVQGSREIARELDRLVALPPLFPADPGLRAAVEEAERWGEAELQPVPRKIFRWMACRDPGVRAFVARDAGLPLPAITGQATLPAAHILRRAEGADDAEVRRVLAALPGQIERVDTLIAEGTIGGAEPNAADLQIAPTVRLLLEFGGVAEQIAGRPAERLARRLLPDYPQPPVDLPAAFVPNVRN